jgi:hypothetical protein
MSGSSFEVQGRGNNTYLIRERWTGKRYEGWEALLLSGFRWTDTGYYGATAEEVLRKLRADGKIA